MKPLLFGFAAFAAASPTLAAAFLHDPSVAFRSYHGRATMVRVDGDGIAHPVSFGVHDLIPASAASRGGQCPSLRHAATITTTAAKPQATPSDA